MGTFLKYLFYLILLAVIYLVGRGIYYGDITKQTTVGSVMEQVGDGSKHLATDGANAVEDAMKNKN